MNPSDAAALDAAVTAAAAHEVPLCALDEAQLLAIGWVPPPRGADVEPFVGQASPHDFAGLDDARRRLLASGLARPGATDTPIDLTPAGPLADYLALVTRRRLQLAHWTATVNGTERTVRRLVPLRDAPVVVVERMTVPPHAPAGTALDVEVALAPRDSVAAELAGIAYRPLPGAEVQCVLLAPDRRRDDVPSILVRHGGEARGALTWRSLSLFGRRAPGERIGRRPLVIPRLDEAGYRAHLDRRLRAPEPSAAHPSRERS